MTGYSMRRCVPAVIAALCCGGAALAQETAGTEPVRQTLDTATVRGRYIPDQKKTTTEISSLLDREDFSGQGDSDAAGAIRRVSGVSISGGRFLNMRGLNERYSHTTINGARLPSPEPLKEAAPLDLFPTALIDSILVRKTYSPAVSAHLAAGSVDIRTRSFDGGDNFLHLRLAGSYDDADSLRIAPVQIGVALQDATGLKPAMRQLPDDLRSAFDTGAYGRLPLAGRNALSRLAVDGKEPLLLVGKSRSDLDWGARASFGRGFGSSGGVSGVVSYDSSWTSRVGVRGIGEADLTADGAVTPLSRFDTDSNTNRIKLSSALTGEVAFGSRSSVRALALLTRTTDRQAEIAKGFTNYDRGVRRERLKWTGRQLWAVQLLGEHMPSFGDSVMEASWRLTVAGAGRDAPYGVANEYETVGETLLLRSGSGLSFSEIGDALTEAALDVTMPVALGTTNLDIGIGASYANTERESSSHTLVAQNIPAAARSLRVDHAYWQALNDPFWAFGTVQSARSPSFYRGTQTVLAGYLKAEAEFGALMRLAIGGRYEDFTQSAETATGRLGPALSPPELHEVGFHPSALLTWSAIDNGQLRLGWSRAVVRPRFRELGPNRFTDPESGEQFSGNPFLRPTHMDNFDLRFEYYFDLGQFVTLGLFHKELRDPIETFNVGSGESRLITFVNLDRAVVQGIELEFSRVIGLDRMFRSSWFRQRDFRIKANLTWSRSSIAADSPVIFMNQSASAQLADRVARLDADSTITLEELRAIGALDERDANFTPDRALQGQSDILANVQLGYFNASTGGRFSMLFGYVGERIRAVESIADDSPAILEQLPVSLDLVYSRPVRIGGREFRLAAKAVNVLGGSYRAFQRSGGQEVDVVTYRSGRSVHMSMELRL